MELFINKILSFILFVLLSFIIIICFNYYLINQFAIETKNEPILLLGDSNMQCAINDSIFNSSVNKAASADSYFYSFLKLHKIAHDDQDIDTVLLSFAPHNLFDNGWLINNKILNLNLPLYYPLMEWSDFKFLLLKNPNAVLASFPDIIKRSCNNLIYLVRSKPPSYYGGFIGLNRYMLNIVQLKLKNGEPLPFFKIPENFEVSPGEKKYLDKIIELCEQKSIKLILINTPKRFEILEYPKYGLDEFYKFYDANYQNVDFIDLGKFCLPDDNYGDFVHLNIKGSTTFSRTRKNNHRDCPCGCLHITQL